MRQTTGESPVGTSKVSHHFHPEPWADAREGDVQALTGVWAGLLRMNPTSSPRFRGGAPLKHELNNHRDILLPRQIVLTLRHRSCLH